MTAHRPSQARLSPAYETDTPLDRLRTPELFLLSTLRLWIAGAVDPEGRHPRWSEGCHVAGLRPAAVTGFDAFWRLMAAAPRRPGHAPLDLRCPTCPRLGADEAWFLQAVQALQAGEDRATVAILARWLPPAAQRLALPPLMALAAGLLEAELALPDRARLPALPAGTLTTACPDRGLGLVH